jgi:protein tyrosine phosphatase (PTP) superfamily phosphohydrolase (DUF442 family)
MSPRKFLVWSPLIFAVALMGGAWGWTSRPFAVTEVVAASIYRSAQPSPRDLRHAASHLGVRTVVNLRGEHMGAEWYEHEREAAVGSNLNLVDLPFETFDWPPRIETLELVAALDESDGPVLLHCWSGRDRSSWAAGVALLLEGAPVERARSEMSLLRGHLCMSGSCPLHAFFDEYESWLTRHGHTHAAGSFRRWITDDYYPEPYRAGLTIDHAPESELVAGDQFSMTVVVTNGARTSWRAGAGTQHDILPGVRLLGPFDQLPSDVVSRFRVAFAPASDVWRHHWQGEWLPGEERKFTIELDAPPAPGLWVAQIDMVHEGVHWFSDLGGPGLIVPFRVEEYVPPGS